MTDIPSHLYHVTTEKKARQYRQSFAIIAPIRGFTMLLAAMAWAMKTGRKVIYSAPTVIGKTHKLPDHHNAYGEAWWIDQNISVDLIKCVYSAGSSNG